jgi:hypothetical protein
MLPKLAPAPKRTKSSFLAKISAQGASDCCGFYRTVHERSSYPA